MIQKSQTVKRFQLITLYGDKQKTKSLNDFYIVAEAPLETKKKSFWHRLLSPGRPKVDPNDTGIPYLDAVQFSQTLLERPASMRLEIIEKQVKTLHALSQLELYTTLTAIPGDLQFAAYKFLEPKLVGRVDFYSLNFLRKAADVDSENGLEVTAVNPNIILHDIRKTGDHFNVFQTYFLLRSLHLKPNEIYPTLSGLRISHDELTEFVNHEGRQTAISDLLSLTSIFVKSSPNLEIIERGRRILKSKFRAKATAEQIDNLTNSISVALLDRTIETLSISNSPFAYQQSFDRAYSKGKTPDFRSYSDQILF